MSEGTFFVTGAARSGKSRYAENLAASLGVPVLYVATAEALDDEMRRRVGLHRARRPDGWTTLEARRDVAAAVEGTGFRGGVVLLDCLSLLVSNLLLDRDEQGGGPDSEDEVWREVEAEMGALFSVVRGLSCGLILVSNEVGWGVVPPSRLGRVYRDLLGRANQLAAREASNAVLLVAGMPLVLKGDPPPEPRP